jgi:hypothetical protein
MQIRRHFFPSITCCILALAAVSAAQEHQPQHSWDYGRHMDRSIRMSTQLALDKVACEMLLLLSMSCNKRLAFRKVSSSFYLSAAKAGRTSSGSAMEIRRQGRAFPRIAPQLFAEIVRNMGLSPFLLRV